MGTSRPVFLAGAVTLACWAITVQGARSMRGAMPMPGGWSMSMAWMPMSGQSLAAAALMFLAMWTVMMVAMMLPSVMPVMLLHRRLLESRASRGVPVNGSNLLLLAGYFGVWTAFGVVAYSVGISVTGLVMRSAELSRAVPMLSGATLAVAGLYQVTPWKQVCLSHCRSPIDFIAHHPIRTTLDSLKFGIHHGAYCAACCWALMAIQLVLGIMSLPLMLAVALVILIEKQWRYGDKFATAVGAAAIVYGTVLLLRAVSGQA